MNSTHTSDVRRSLDRQAKLEGLAVVSDDDAQALADLRTLDDFAIWRGVGIPTPIASDGCSNFGPIWTVSVPAHFVHPGQMVEAKDLEADTPTEARAKAAKWVREQAKGAK